MGKKPTEIDNEEVEKRLLRSLARSWGEDFSQSNVDVDAFGNVFRISRHEYMLRLGSPGISKSRRDMLKRLNFGAMYAASSKTLTRVWGRKNGRVLISNMLGRRVTIQLESETLEGEIVEIFSGSVMQNVSGMDQQGGLVKATVPQPVMMWNVLMDSGQMICTVASAANLRVLKEDLPN